MQTVVYLSRPVGWSDTPQAPKLIGDEPPGRMACRGSSHQAPKSMLVTTLPSHTGDGATKTMLVVAQYH
jgi:hypothetical protein